MEFNVQGQPAACLLDWVNLQISHLLGRRSLSAWSQVLNQGSIYTILQNVDNLTFQNFHLKGHIQKISIIEKYLDKQFGKRLKWAYKKQMGDLTTEQNIRQLTKLVCYFSIHSKKKNQFVNKILSLSQQCQKFLMLQMQDMEKKLQNITEIRQIIEHILQLEQENDELRKKNLEMARVNEEMLHMMTQSDRQSKKFREEIQCYRKEKCQVFALLKIDNIMEYVEAYRQLKKESQNNQKIIQELEGKLDDCGQHMEMLNKRISSDSIVISSLQEQITRLKQMINYGIRDSCELLPCSGSKQNMLKSIISNKENMSKCSTSLGKSIYLSSQWVSEQQKNEKSLIRAQNNQLMQRLQETYKKYQDLSNQANELRNKNKKLKKSYFHLKNVLKQVQQSYQEFEFKYKSVCIEGNLQLAQRTQQKINRVHTDF